LDLIEPPKKDSLSPEQQKVVDSNALSLVVSAAAGSGKTRVLVERYLKHAVDQGFRPDHILTITFTRKAAAEMKRRIVDRLLEAGLAEEAQIAETGPIQTIHGFCERLLRENSFMAGIDPDFEILGEAQADRLLERSVQAVLSTLDEDTPQAIGLVSKLAGKRSYGNSFSPHARLEKSIRDALHGWRGTGTNVDLLDEQYANPVALLAAWRSKLLDVQPPEVLALYAEDRGSDGLAAKLAAAYKALRKTKPRYIRPSLDEDLEAAEQTCGLMQIVCRVWRRFEANMAAQQLLDFTQLESMAVNLLARSPAVCERLQKQYPVVLIDEAQDLNPVQYELLRAMAPQSEMFVGDVQQSIYGFRQADVKLFQQKLASAEPARLPTNHRSQDGILAFVDRVFGSIWPDQYTPMLRRPMHLYPGVELWVQPQSDKELTSRWIKDLVDERATEGKPIRDIAVLVRRSSYAMDLYKKLTSLGVPARVSGGTEQFYARLEVRDLANALEAVSDPCDDFALAALLRSPFVNLSLDTIVLLANARQEQVFEEEEEDELDDEEERRTSLFDALDGFFSPVDEDNFKLRAFRSWFEPLTGYADRLSAWELISELFAKTPYLENLARRDGAVQRIANVRKLLALAASQPDLGPQAYAELIRDIQAIRHKEGDAPASDQNADEVTIMTIHKSKGLEFPVVVLPDTHLKLSWGAQDIEIDPWLQMMTTKFGPSSSMFHEWLGVERQSREENEEWRVMYVAFTRAKERLCVVVNPSGAGERVADKLGKHIGFKNGVPPGIMVREATNLPRQ
jgi:ATP-dependent helicase/nuclease subunit A